MYITKTRAEFIKYFKQEYLPGIRQQEKDWQGTDMPTADIPLRREEWNNLIDCYVKDNLLPRKAMDWSAPW